MTQGSVTKPNQEATGLYGDTFYLPQKPYNALGDLRCQLTYPVTSEAARKALSDRQLTSLLEVVGLGYLLSKDKDPNWVSNLSLGETQRLAMARLFYHTPTYAILDECTSAVSSEMERYGACVPRHPLFPYQISVYMR